MRGSQLQRTDNESGSNPAVTDAAAPAKVARLEAQLAALGRVGVALSGGVDSAYLLAVAVSVLGPDATAFIAVSPSLPEGELAAAHALASSLGTELLEVVTHEMDDPRYRANDPRRCYYCKSHLYSTVIATARERGIDVLLDGNNRDDLGDYRPGLEAARERGVHSPLADAGFTKAEIRAEARKLGLAVWDKPAMPCLASRVPYDSPVTGRKLAQIDAAERFLRGLGFSVVRVRHHDAEEGVEGAKEGAEARIEVEAGEVARLTERGLRARVEAELAAIGFATVTVDLSGYRSGKLNDGLADRDPVGDRGSGTSE